MPLPTPCNIDQECLKFFACNTLETPRPGIVYSPYVEMAFGSLFNNNRIFLGVGNNSAPSSNLAAIKSFNYGLTGGSTGTGIEMEIIDNGAALYRDIIRNLNKSIKTREVEVSQVEIDYGWIITESPSVGGTGIPRLYTAKTAANEILRGMLREVETNFSNGNVTIKLKLTPPEVQDVALTGSIGSNDQMVSLKDAIRELLTREDVGFSDVYFRSAFSVDDKGETDDLEFKNSDGGKDGPKSVWPMDQQNALAIVRQWLMNVTSDDGRGLLMVYDMTNNAIVIQEDPMDKEGAEACCNASVGTYVVNGGGCSPVIEFNPSFEWPLGTIPGRGGTGGGASGAKQPILEPTKRIQNAGSETSPVIEQHVWNYRVPEDQAEEANEATAANIETEQTSGPGVVGAGTGLTAELKIIGDPFYTNGVNFVAKFVSIVFISPFYIGNSKDVKRTGPTWLQTSNCNSILSNKKYLIQGISHNISNGTFTTTLSLKLLAPNLDIPYLSDLGGNGCGSLDGNFEDADAPTVE